MRVPTEVAPSERANQLFRSSASPASWRFSKTKGGRWGASPQGEIKSRLIADLDPKVWDLPPKPKMDTLAYIQSPSIALCKKFDAYEDILNQNIAATLARFLEESSTRGFDSEQGMSASS